MGPTSKREFAVIESKAYVLRETGSFPNLEEILVETALTRGQVLVSVEYASFCGTQIEEIFTSKRNKRFMPHLFGHEASGKVVAVGSGVANIRTGDSVVIHWRPSGKGLEAEAGRYWQGGRRLNAGKVVALSEYVVVPENRLTKKPQSLSDSDSVLLGCSATTGWGSALKVAPNRAGSVFIAGIGGVGAAAAVAAHQAGMVVYALDKRTLTQSQLEILGVSHLFHSLEEVGSHFEESALASFPELAIDTTGSHEVINFLQAKVPGSGSLVLVGMPKGTQLPNLDVQKLLDGLRIFGSNGGSVDASADFQYVAPVVSQLAELSHSGLLSKMSWESLQEALELYMQGKLLKVILTVEKGGDFGD